MFVKRIPITDRELAHPHSTANLFGLPAGRQYGVYRLAGPGFGARAGDRMNDFCRRLFDGDLDAEYPRR